MDMKGRLERPHKRQSTSAGGSTQDANAFKPHDAHRYLQQRWHKVLHALADPNLPVSERPKKYAPPTTNKGWGASKLLHQVPIGDFLLELSLKMKRTSGSG